tara:strand:+ start:1308 stop:1550 length:243 start_codon:yes stop_codon:yes gene_type:complete
MFRRQLSDNNEPFMEYAERERYYDDGGYDDDDDDDDDEDTADKENDIENFLIGNQYVIGGILAVCVVGIGFSVYYNHKNK